MDPTFRSLDRLAAPDLEAEVVERLVRDAARDIPPAPHRGRRVVAGALALLIFAAAGAFAWEAFEGVEQREQVSDDAFSWAPEGWSELPPPPEWRDGAAIVWTDTELLYLGGSVRGVDDPSPEADGFAFDPDTAAWRRLAAGPRAGTGGTAVWTGTEAIVFRASDGRGEDVAPLAFDPVAGTWRELAPSPFSPSWGGTSIWTGSELLVVGGGMPGSPTATEGYALDPAANVWRELPPLPAPVNLAGAAWTGGEAVIVGSAVDGRNHAETRTSIAMAYSPRADRWLRLPDPPVSSQTADVAFVGGRLIAWELYSPAAAEYLPAEDRWRSLDTDQVNGGECYAQGVTVGAVLFSWGCGRPAAFFAATSAFVPLEPPDLDVEAPEFGYGWGTAYAAGRAAIVEQVETVLRDGGPYIGAPDAPMHLLVWRPPAVSPSPDPSATPADAENLVGEFMADWLPGWTVYLPTLATADVIERCRSGAGGLIPLEGWSIRTWNSYLGKEVAPGVYEVRIGLIRDGEVIATQIFTVGPGTTADGRDGLLVVIDVRPV